jgi:hypothetical protein
MSPAMAVTNVTRNSTPAMSASLLVEAADGRPSDPAE